MSIKKRKLWVSTRVHSVRAGLIAAEPTGTGSEDRPGLERTEDGGTRMHVRGDAPYDPEPASVPAPPAVPAAGPPGVVEGVWRFAAPAVDLSVPQARHAVRDLLAAQGMTGPAYVELVEGLLLIVSELVTNAVRHAALLSPQIVVEVVIGAGWVRLSVEDSHPYRPQPLENDFARTGGRGLLLVRAITLEAGGVCDVERTPGGGKTVWSSLPLPTADDRPPQTRPPAPRPPAARPPDPRASLGPSWPRA
jgi:anti-sigma regulatory factor (Ser/Thr protein kinase)